MLIALNKLMSKLATTNRYSDTRLINPESVLEHTGYVALTSMFIAMKLIDAGESINIGELLQKCLLHDIEEAKMGDIITPTKHSSIKLKLMLNSYAEECAEDVLASVYGYPETLNIWKQSKYGKEGYIVEIADALSVVYIMEREIIYFGNMHLKLHMNEGLFRKLEKLKDLAGGTFENDTVIKTILNEGLRLCNLISKHT